MHKMSTFISAFRVDNMMRTKLALKYEYKCYISHQIILLAHKQNHFYES